MPNFVFWYKLCFIDNECIASVFRELQKVVVHISNRVNEG